MPKRRPLRPTKAGTRPKSPPAGYAPVLKLGVQATVQTVQDMHFAIADMAFDSIRLLPGLSLPSRIVQGVHDGITQGVYAAVRHGSGALMSMAGAAERAASDTAALPHGRHLAARSALNGVFGDALAQANHPMSVSMGFYRNGAPLALDRPSLSALREHTCVFIHGLACDEQSWQRTSASWHGSAWESTLAAGEPIHYGALLERELGVSALYLRYNSGLAIEENARLLSEQLEQLLFEAPVQVRKLTLIGHSMGGLVARSACEMAAADAAPWLARMPMLICLGSPHQGALLEKLGHLAGQALGAFEATRPLARVAAARSQGIKDLRHGLKRRAGADSAAPSPSPSLRLLAGSLADDSTNTFGTLIGKALGDGLVLPGSASDDGLEGDVKRVMLDGLGHMTLLNHPRVYTQIKNWLQEQGPD